MGALCSTRTIRRHFNNEKIKHKKKIHRPSLTMKHKEKRLEYVCQYRTMSAKEWRKVVGSDVKKSNLDGPDSFQKYCHAKNFPEKNYSTRRIFYDEGGEGASHLQENLNYNLSAVDKSSRLCKDAKWFISCTRSASSMWRRMDFFSKIMLLSTIHQ